ncbi:MAG: tRNA 4-thiouridine(8) synthase ThiI, partial [Lachnospiraceae bacterium]|nr:tRNA 4-thiouridine(8) synthase ThiI [Lachnospiraceae bacterium]
MTFKAFLIKYAEIGVKGSNRYVFENALVKRIEEALAGCEGEFALRKESGRIFVDVISDTYDYDEAVAALQKVFGISEFCPMVQFEDEGFEQLAKDVVGYIGEA